MISDFELRLIDILDDDYGPEPERRRHPSPEYEFYFHSLLVTRQDKIDWLKRKDLHELKKKTLTYEELAELEDFEYPRIVYMETVTWEVFSHIDDIEEKYGRIYSSGYIMKTSGHNFVKRFPRDIDNIIGTKITRLIKTLDKSRKLFGVSLDSDELQVTFDDSFNVNDRTKRGIYLNKRPYEDIFWALTEEEARAKKDHWINKDIKAPASNHVLDDAFAEREESVKKERKIRGELLMSQQKVSKPRPKQVWTPEMREKISEANRNRRLSPETRSKISATRKATNAKKKDLQPTMNREIKLRGPNPNNLGNSKPVQCVETGEIFKSMVIAYDSLNLDPTVSISFKSNTMRYAIDNNKEVGGYHWTRL